MRRLDVIRQRWAPRRSALQAQPAATPFGVFERVVWAGIAVGSTLVVLLHDGPMTTTIAWLLGILFFGQFALPAAFRFAHKFVSRNDNLYLGVICGWGLVPGPFVGVLAGVLIPFVYNLELSSFAGGLIGIIFGPCVAIIEGLLIVATVDAVVWLATRVSLRAKTSN